MDAPNFADVDSANSTYRYMQFHPLAYMVKLKIEMSMADLIAKVARKREPLATIQTTTPSTFTSGRAQTSLSRFQANFSLSRNKDQVLPLPPVRVAVNFRDWSTATSDPLGSLASRGAGTTSRNSIDGAAGSPEPAGMDSSGREMYMLQEIVVETNVVDASDTDGGRPEEAIHNRLVDDPAARQAVPTGGIWDGSASLSTSVRTGHPTDLDLNRDIS